MCEASIIFDEINLAVTLKKQRIHNADRFKLIGYASDVLVLLAVAFRLTVYFDLRHDTKRHLYIGYMTLLSVRYGRYMTCHGVT